MPVPLQAGRLHQDAEDSARAAGTARHRHHPPGGGGNHRHGHDTATAVSSFTIRFEQPVAWRGLAVTLGGILLDHGSKLLRAKGLVAVTGSDTPMVVQCVRDVAYPAVRLVR